MANNSDMHQLVRKLRKAGYQVIHTRGDHLRVNAPGGPVYLPSTPGRGRSMKNTIALLKRNGVQL